MKKMITLILMFCLALNVLCACSAKETQPPEINLTRNGEKVSYELMLSVWNNVAYDRPEIFSYMFDYSLDSIIPAKKNNSFKVDFNKNVPDKVGIRYTIFDKKHDIVDENEIAAKNLNGVFVFELEDYLSINSSYDSSVSHDDFYVGIKIECEWGNNRCEYAVILQYRSNIENETVQNTEYEGNKFKCTIYRTDSVDAGIPEENYAELITNYAELSTYYHENKSKFNFEYGEESFADAISAYDDKFFDDSLIILAQLNEKSDAFVLDLLSAERRNGNFTLTFERKGAFTRAAKARWHALIEISKDAYSGETISVVIADSTEKTENTVSEPLYLISNTASDDVGFENAFEFMPDGSVKADINNYVGFYACIGTYVLSNDSIELVTDNTGKIVFGYSKDKNCWVISDLSESKMCGTLYEGTELYICDGMTYDSVISFHNKWNSDYSDSVD